MNKTEQTICNLISSSLFGTELSFPQLTDWNDVFREAQQQTIIGIVAASAPEEIRKSWSQSIYQNVAKNTRNSYEQDQLIHLFSEAGIPMVILKGSAAAIYYTDPNFRSMGDIDFLVPQEKFDESVELMKKNGYIISHKNDEPYPRHIGFKKNGVRLELHHHFSYKDLDIEKYIIEGLQNINIGTVNKKAFPMLPPMANGLVLLAHMRSHLISGLGLRQVIDWMMYCDKILNNEFWEQDFRSAAEDIGLDTLAITVTRMCQIYLGLKESITWCSCADEQLCSKLLDNLFASGNFGVKQGKENQVKMIIITIKREGLFRYLQRAGERNWKAYKKYKWLKPICWVYQIIRYIRLGLKTGKEKELFSDISYGNERVELLKELGI